VERSSAGLRLLVAVAAAMVAAAGWTQGQAPAAQPMGISVSGVGGARSALTLTYPTDPGDLAAATDVQALATLGGWTISPPVRAEDQGSVFYEAEASPAIGSDPSGDPPLFPFLKAFSRYPELALIFIGSATSQPSSGSGSNRYVRAAWNRSGGVTSYTIRVLNDSFASPEDLLLSAAGGEPEELPKWRHVVTLWVLLVVGSVGAGVFVWGLTWWLLSLREARTRAAEEGKATEPDQHAERDAADPAAVPEQAPVAEEADAETSK
jgi:hypothetical protein